MAGLGQLVVLVCVCCVLIADMNAWDYERNFFYVSLDYCRGEIHAFVLWIERTEIIQGRKSIRARYSTKECKRHERHDQGSELLFDYR